MHYVSMCSLFPSYNVGLCSPSPSLKTAYLPNSFSQDRECHQWQLYENLHTGIGDCFQDAAPHPCTPVQVAALAGIPGLLL